MELLFRQEKLGENKAAFPLCPTYCIFVSPLYSKSPKIAIDT